MPLKNWCSIHAICFKNSLKHSIRFCGLFPPSLKHSFIAYRSYSRPDCIFEIHQLWQSSFSRVYSNCCCSCSFEPEIIKIGQSSHTMYSNKILNYDIAHAEKVWKLIVCNSYIYIYIYIYVCVCVCVCVRVCVCVHPTRLGLKTFPNECFGYDTKPSDNDAIVLGLLQMFSVPLLPLSPGSLCSVMAESFMILSLGQSFPMDY